MAEGIYLDISFGKENPSTSKKDTQFVWDGMNSGFVFIEIV